MSFEIPTQIKRPADRFDLRVNVAPVTIDVLQSTKQSESSQAVRSRVEMARSRMAERFDRVGVSVNSAVRSPQLNKYCPLTPKAKALLGRAIKHFELSARAFDRIRRVAWTIADLCESDVIRATHISEAIHFRNDSSSVDLSRSP